MQRGAEIRHVSSHEKRKNIIFFDASISLFARDTEALKHLQTEIRVGDMAKKTIPVLDMQQQCRHSQTYDFKVARLNDTSCSTMDFEQPHSHEYFEIIWLQNGEGIHYLDMLPHPYIGPVLFVVAPGQIHSIQQQTLSDGYVVRFFPSIFQHEEDFYRYVLDSCIFDTKTSCPIVMLPNDINQRIEQLFVQMIEEFYREEDDVANVISSYIEILAVQIHRAKRRSMDPTLITNNPQYSLFRQFKMAVEQHYKTEHSVQSYAELLHTQTRTLNTVAQKYGNKSASETIQERIVLEAQRSLHHESKSVKEIGFSLGFDDPAYFTRFFKKHTGTTPQDFKGSISKIVLQYPL